MTPIRRLWSGFRSRVAPPVAAAQAAATRPDEAPLRSVLYTADQMTQHAARLAAEHDLTTAPAQDRLLARLASNERVLLDVRGLLVGNARMQRRETPAGEWLLDNFYLIEGEIRAAHRHLPPGYSRELPRLRSGPSAGLPRVYDLALHLVAHGDASLGRGAINGFVAAYQSVAVLQLGELWAIPIMLRLALIENLRRLAARIGKRHEERNLADTWADRMLDASEKNPKDLILVIAEMARSDPPQTSAFVAELVRRLQGRSAALALPLSWVELRLAESHRTIEQLVKAEGQDQAAEQVSVSNSIGSLRLLEGMDWQSFVEDLSSVEQALRLDPAGAYARMDFTTRDRYRHAVERLARACPRPEAEVAAAAVELAARALASGAAAPQSHVGHYLIGAGQVTLERSIGVRPRFWRRPGRLLARHQLLAYGGAIAVTTVGLSAGVVWLAGGAPGTGLPTTVPIGWLLAVGALLLLAQSQLAVALINWAAARLARPNLLPRMDFSLGIPADSQTLVVVPTLLGSMQGIEDLAEAAGSPLRRQSRGRPALRPADRFPRCCLRAARRRRRAAAAGARTDRRPQPQARRPRRRRATG